MGEFATGFGEVPKGLALEGAARPGGNGQKVAPATKEAGTTLEAARPGGSKGQGTHRASAEKHGFARPGKAGSGTGA